MSVSFASELKIQVGKYSKSKADDIDTDLQVLPAAIR